MDKNRIIEILTELSKMFKKEDLGIRALQIISEPMTESKAYEKGLLETKSYRDIPGYYVKFGNEWEKWMTEEEFQKFQERLYKKNVDKLFKI